MSFGAEHSICCWKAWCTESEFFKLFENIYWQVPAQGSFALLFLCCCSHPNGPFPEPSWNPSETDPLLPRLAQETVADKRQEASHQANGSLMTVFITRHTKGPSLMMGSVSDNVYLTAGRQKIAQHKEGHTARLPGMLLPKRESRKTFVSLLPHFLCSVHVTRSQLKMFKLNGKPLSIPSLQSKAGTTPWSPSEQGTLSRIWHSWEVPRAFPLSLPKKVAWADDCTIWEHFSQCCGHLCRLGALSPELPPKSYAFWNTVTLHLGQRFQLHSPSVVLTVLKSTCKAALSDIYFVKLKCREGKKNRNQYLSAAP